MTQIISVPLDKLVPGAKSGINSRKTDAPVEGLAKSIEEHGLLVPLLVRVNGDGRYDVVDGNRRLAALQLLRKKNRGPGGIIVEAPCVVGSHDDPLEVSMVVNVDREGLHPVDRFEVFAALVGGGETVDAVAKRYGLKVAEVRQALALGRMAPQVRDAWRDGKISAETAEAFAMTRDHKAQVAVLKKVGRHTSAYHVRQALMGGVDEPLDKLLKFVGKDAYEKAGYEVNASLFADEDDERRYATVSDLPALRRLADEKLEAKCEALVKEGWKWAVPKDKAPRDVHAWARIYSDGGRFTKEQMANAGCAVDLDYGGNIFVDRGYVKPGDKKVVTPKTPKQKKAEQKKRAEQKEETGGLSNALATRLSSQLTAAVREAFVAGLEADDVVSFTVAALACEEAPTTLSMGRHRGVGVYDPDAEETRDNDFAKYYKLARGKTAKERVLLLATWVAASIELGVHRADQLVALLHPGKDEPKGARILVEQLHSGVMLAAMVKHFDAADYFGSVSKELIVEAVGEACGKEQAAAVAKMKSGEAKAYAIKNVGKKTAWLPKALRI